MQNVEINLNTTAKQNSIKTSRYQRKLAASLDYLKLLKKNPMSDAVIDQVIKRKIKVKGKWLADFASCNYLGFDVHPEVMASTNDHIELLSTYPGQSRLLGSPFLYEKLEQEICKVTEIEDCLVLPSITLTHLYALPILAEEGDLFLDKRAHKTLYDGCMRATQYGAKMISFKHNDCEDLEEKLKQSKAKKKLICVDGVYGMDGYSTPVKKMVELCKKYDAYLYLDDAHGFGVVGKRSPNELCSFGTGGGGIVLNHGADYERIIFIGSLSKAYSALLGFISCSKEQKDYLKVAIDPYLYSGPAPVSALSCLLKSFEVNQKEGDEIRHHLFKMSKKVEEALTSMKFKNVNYTGFPVYRLTMENIEDVHFAGQFLYDHGVYVTLAPYPLVPHHEAGFRIQVTAANTHEEIDHLLETLKKLDKHARIKRVEETPSIRVKINNIEPKTNKTNISQN